MARQMHRENSSVPAALRMHGERATRQMFMQTKLNGGTTVDLTTFDVPAKTDGYFVGKAPNYAGEPIESVLITEDTFTLASLRRTFGKLYADHLTREQIEDGHDGTPLKDRYIGTWAHEGVIYVDAVNWTADYAEAVEWAVARGEHSIYDVAANGALEVMNLRVDTVIAA